MFENTVCSARIAGFCPQVSFLSGLRGRRWPHLEGNAGPPIEKGERARPSAVVFGVGRAAVKFLLKTESAKNRGRPVCAGVGAYRKPQFRRRLCM